MNNFTVYKIYQGITILCALVFLCIKTFEYRDKFNHYEVQPQERAPLPTAICNRAKQPTQTVVALEGRGWWPAMPI